MLVHAGIDEAGYGPMFGPLCVAACTIVLDNSDPADGPPDVWELLRKSVCRSPRDRRKRIAINDSKKLKAAGGGVGSLRHLERGVLSFLAAADPEHPIAGGRGWSDVTMLQFLGAETPMRPWTGDPRNIPVSNDESSLRVDAARLRRTLADSGGHIGAMYCRAIDAGTYNERTSLESKAALNFATAMELADAIARRHRGEHPRILVDRHGGRIRYLRALQQCWPDASIQVLAEDERMSRYRLRNDEVEFTLSFESKCDERYLPVALASMIAKYVRELHMLRLNRFFHKRLPDLQPTAGYVMDGRRFLREIEPVLDEDGLDRSLLVRNS